MANGNLIKRYYFKKYTQGKSLGSTICLSLQHKLENLMVFFNVHKLGAETLSIYYIIYAMHISKWFVDWDVFAVNDCSLVLIHSKHRIWKNLSQTQI